MLSFASVVKDALIAILAELEDDQEEPQTEPNDEPKDEPDPKRPRYDE